MIGRHVILQYNREHKQFLSDVWAVVPKGRQKQFLKNPLNRACLIRFGIIKADDDDDESLGRGLIEE